MAYYLIGAILVSYYNTAAKSLPVREVTEYYEESLDDIIKKGEGIGAVIPESVTVSTDDNHDIFKIVKDFIGNENDVKRTLFFCKEGLCKVLNGGDLNASVNKTDGIIKAPKKKLANNSSEEKIKEIFKAKENEVLSLEATHNRNNKEEDSEDQINGEIKSMPKMKFRHIFKGNKYVRLQLNTDPFDVTMTTPALPKLVKFKFPKTRVPVTTTIRPRILLEDSKVLLMPETIDEVIRQYQMYPGAGCAYVRGCDGLPIKVLKSPQAMALIAKIYREVLEQPDVGHQVISFYLNKYEPQHVYIEGEQYTPKKVTKGTTTIKSYSECFLY